ncbi:uncharacterized protein A4U43_C03F10420 [Asparagus officinalis]|uniref:Uncharacterized protein n=1 Tax=Asparagus officinalis TaxID=4686 RepID=A0A5P1F911_ASPOF|nr:uncharacterized protein A4U43_C03F10420 [Asparagus officinalis]
MSTSYPFTRTEAFGPQETSLSTRIRSEICDGKRLPSSEILAKVKGSEKKRDVMEDVGNLDDLWILYAVAPLAVAKLHPRLRSSWPSSKRPWSFQKMLPHYITRQKISDERSNPMTSPRSQPSSGQLTSQHTQQWNARGPRAPVAASFPAPLL